MALVEPLPVRMKDLGGVVHNSCYCLGTAFQKVLWLDARSFKSQLISMELQDPKLEERDHPKLTPYVNRQGVEYRYTNRCVTYDIYSASGTRRCISFVCPDYLTGHVFVTMRGVTLLSEWISVRPRRERYKGILRAREWIEERIPCPNIGRVHGIYLGNLYSSSRYCPHVRDGLGYLVSQLTYLVGGSGEGELNTDVLEYQLTARAAYTLWTVGKLLPMEYVLYADSLWHRLNSTARFAVREERGLVEPLIHAIEQARTERANASRPYINASEVLSNSNTGLDHLADAPLMAIV